MADAESEVFVGKLPFSTDETALREFFEASGAKVSSLRLLRKADGRSKGCAFVGVADVDGALALSGSKLGGRQIKVEALQEPSDARKEAKARAKAKIARKERRVAEQKKHQRAQDDFNLDDDDDEGDDAKFVAVVGNCPYASPSLDRQEDPTWIPPPRRSSNQPRRTTTPSRARVSLYRAHAPPQPSDTTCRGRSSATLCTHGARAPRS